MLWTEAAFNALFGMALTRLRHWQCNWWVAWTSLRTYEGKRQTLRSTFVTMFISHMKRGISIFVKCDTIFRLFFLKLPQFHTSNFRKVARQHTEGIVRFRLTSLRDFGRLTLYPSYVTETMHIHEPWAGQWASSHVSCARHAWLMFRPGSSFKLP